VGARDEIQERYKALGLRHRDIYTDPETYEERTRGKVRCVCGACGLVFYAEVRRTTCSIRCFHDRD